VHRGKPRWEYFCKQCLLSDKPRSQIIQVPFYIFPHRSSSLRDTVVAIQSNTRPIGGHIFWGLDVQSLRRYQCPRVLDRQTRASPFYPSRETLARPKNNFPFEPLAFRFYNVTTIVRWLRQGSWAGPLEIERRFRFMFNWGISIQGFTVSTCYNVGHPHT
jgi:hypothetical protein